MAAPMELDGKGNIRLEKHISDPNTQFLSSWCLSFESREAMKNSAETEVGLNSHLVSFRAGER